MIQIPVEAALIGALAGTFSGGIIAEWRNVLQLRRESRKTLNQVLFSQLEIVYRLKRSRIEPSIRALKEILTKRFGAESNAILEMLLTQPAFVNAVTRAVGGDWPTTIDLQYQDAVNKISEVNPLLAYRLSGRNAVAKYGEYVQGLLEAMRSTIGDGASPSDAAAMTSVKGLLEETLQADAISDVRSDAELVARALGWNTLRKVRKLMDRPSNPSEAEFASVFDPLIKQLETLLVADAGGTSIVGAGGLAGDFARSAPASM